MSLSLPLVGFPHETIPEAWARIAASLGFLASNRSATLGNPPVISFVLADCVTASNKRKFLHGVTGSCPESSAPRPLRRC